MIKRIFSKAKHEILERSGLTFYKNPQEYSCNYTLRIKNIGEEPIDYLAVLPVPAESSTQKLTRKPTFRPEPKIESDKTFGNQFAYWQGSLKPSHSVTLSEYFQAKVKPFQAGVPAQLSLEDYAKLDKSFAPYLKQGKSLKTAAVKDIVSEILEKSQTLEDIIYGFNDYILKNLRYGDPIEGLYSSKEALDRECVDCGGFSNLFISMCQAAGIPARLVSGFWAGYRKNIMHAWPEFALPDGTWIPVDTANEQLRAQRRSRKLGEVGQIGSDRIVLSYGSDHTLKTGKVQLKTDILQTPIVHCKQGANNLHIDYDLHTKRL